MGAFQSRAHHPGIAGGIERNFIDGLQMVEISRDGKRVYWTNALYSSWDNRF